MKPFISPEELLTVVRSVVPGIIEFRHRLHETPETKFEEFETARLIRERLSKLPVEVLDPLVGTDTIALLRGRADGGNVLLRADIDALPLGDKGGKAWSSKRAGVSHACGHDGHAAILAGTAETLARLAERFCGSVRFVFQPAEEEGGGGRELVKKGMLEIEPRPGAVWGLHGIPEFEVGQVASRPGRLMAAADRFSLEVIGRGGHGAQPHTVIDPVVLAAQIILALQTIPSRMVSPTQPVVLSVCMVHGGDASNIIPESVRLNGTVRHFDNALRDRIKERIEAIARGIAGPAGGKIEFEYREGYIPTINDPRKVAFARELVETYLGPDKWEDIPEPSMGGEDFAYYLEKVPGAFLRLGMGKGGPGLHNPAYDFNDAAIENGIVLMSALALETLAGV